MTRPRSAGSTSSAGCAGSQQPSGRFSDRTPFGDFSGIFTQSFALLALDRTAAGAPPAAVVVPGRRALRRRWIPAAVRPADVRQRGRHHRDGDTGPDRRGPARRRGREPSVAPVRAARRRRVRQLLRGAQRHRYGACRDRRCAPAAASSPRSRHVVPDRTPGRLLRRSGPARRGSEHRRLLRPAFTTPRSTALAVLGLSGSDFPHLSARGSRSGAPSLSLPVDETVSLGRRHVAGG